MPIENNQSPIINPPPARSIPPSIQITEPTSTIVRAPAPVQTYTRPVESVNPSSPPPFTRASSTLVPIHSDNQRNSRY